jgi:hypothetical protein
MTSCGGCKSCAKRLADQCVSPQLIAALSIPSKEKPGAHASGRAVDVGVSRSDAYALLRLAIRMGFSGIGVQQKGNGRFLHIDDLEAKDGWPRPTIWSY